MRIRLRYKEIQEVKGGDGIGIIILTDESEQRALSVVCDKATTEQFRQRILSVPVQSQLLPEVLVDMLRACDDFDVELNIYGVDDGQYKVTLTNKNTLSLHPIRMSDAVLLSYIAQVPIYIDDLLMNRQCSFYVKGGDALAIPINTISTRKLEEELQKAIDEENYRLAAHLHGELKSREKKRNEGE